MFIRIIHYMRIRQIQLAERSHFIPHHHEIVTVNRSAHFQTNHIPSRLIIRHAAHGLQNRRRLIFRLYRHIPIMLPSQTKDVIHLVAPSRTVGFNATFGNIHQVISQRIHIYSLGWNKCIQFYLHSLVVKSRITKFFNGSRQLHRMQAITSIKCIPSYFLKAFKKGNG